MAYFNGYPATYAQPYASFAQNPQPAAPAQQTGRIWVQGEAGARSYLVAPNNTVELWDSEAQVIYLKSADASGMPNIKILDYTVRESNKMPGNSPSAAPNDMSAIYATKDDIEAINGDIKALKKKIEKLTKEGENE